jgi:hypothetical protein
MEKNIKYILNKFFEVYKILHLIKTLLKLIILPKNLKKPKLLKIIH